MTNEDRIFFFISLIKALEKEGIKVEKISIEKTKKNDKKRSKKWFI